MEASYLQISDNDVSPQNFSLDVADGTVQTQDILLLDTHFAVQTDIFDPDNGYVDFNNFAATMQHSDIVPDQALQYRTLYPAGEEDWIRVSFERTRDVLLFHHLCTSHKQHRDVHLRCARNTSRKQHTISRK